MSGHWNRWKRVLGGIAVGAFLAASAHAVPVVSFVATPSPATLGSTLTLDLRVTGAADVFGWQFTLGFDPSKLQVGSVSEGSFLSAGGSTFYGATPDNVAGTVLSFDALIGSVAGVGGSGLLERIVFNVVGTGSSAIGFSDVLFLDSSFNDLGAVANGGNITLVPGGVTPPVPEPATAGLLAAGLLAMGLSRRRRRRHRQATPGAGLLR